MPDTVLFVDDEPNVLSGIKRQLHRKFEIATAEGADNALKLINKNGPFAVIVSDMRMPGMDGVQFLDQCKKRWPDSVRVMLTGNNDQETAIAAVNDGNVYRFLNKPCETDQLVAALEDALRQHALVTAERDLMESTLSGAVKLLIDILSLTDPIGFGETQQMRGWARKVAETVGIKNKWEIELAAMLSRIGWVALPPGVAERARNPETLDSTIQLMITQSPETGSKLLRNIPRLKNVANLVLLQHKRFDGGGFPVNDLAGEEIPLAARILFILNRLSGTTTSSYADAFEELSADKGAADPKLLALINSTIADPKDAENTPEHQDIEIAIGKLAQDDLILSDMRFDDGTLVLAPGQVISEPLLYKIRNLARIRKIREPILVRRRPTK